jgi:hypothetical protein
MKLRKYVMISFLLIFTVVSCGPTDEEILQENEDIHEAKISQMLREITIAYGQSVVFPPKDTPMIFTLELQRFFSDNDDKNIVFKGYLEDIEQTLNGLVISFRCPLSSEPFLDPTALEIRLKSNEPHVNKVLSNYDPDKISRLIRLYSDPDYYVVAKVRDIRKTRMYSFSGASYTEEDVDIEIETYPKFIADGILIDTVAYPNSID